MKYWYSVNGKWVKENKAVISVNDIGLQRGYGAVEVIRVVNGIAYRLDDHLARLTRSLSALKITPPSTSTLERLIKQGLRKNQLLEAQVKVIVTGGLAQPGPSFKGKPSVIIIFTPADPINKKIKIIRDKGVSVITFYAARLYPEVKSLNYVSSVLGYLAARDHGAHEAIFIDARGRVTEGMTSNLFMIKNGIAYTPKRSVLPGITRQRIITLAKKILPIQEIEFLLDQDIKQADELFITSANRGVLPVTTWNGRLVNGGVIGYWTGQLRAAYEADIARECKVKNQ